MRSYAEERETWILVVTVQCGCVISLSPLIILIKGSEISNIKGLEREPAINHRGTLGIATS